MTVGRKSIDCSDLNWQTGEEMISRTSRHRLKQETILAFAQKQSPTKLLRSKDGMKQDKLESYFKPKLQMKIDEKASPNTDLRSKRTKLEPLMSHTSKRPRNELDNEQDVSRKRSNNSVKLNETSNELEIKHFKERDTEDEPVPCDDNDVHEDDLEDLSDSFFSTSWDNTSPFKSCSPKKIEYESIPCIVSTKSTEHCLIKQRHRVTELNLIANNETGFETKIVRLENVASKSTLTCILESGWQNMDLMQGDIVNLITNNETTSSTTITIDGKSNLLVVHPDILLSGTTITNGINCRRRAVLSEIFKNTETSEVDVKPAMMIGSLLHELFQKAVSQRKTFSQSEIKKLTEDMLRTPAMIKDMLSVGTSKQAVLAGVLEIAPNISKWVGEYVRYRPTNGVGKLTLKLPSEASKEFGGSKIQSFSAMTELHDIEENVYSPLYGMKGKIDVTSEFTVKIHGKNKLLKTIFPLELKTGRETNSVEHHAQVVIYSMFCEQRQKNFAIPAGLLLYLKTGNVSCIPLKHADKRELTQLRNQIVSSVVNRVESLKISDKDNKYRTKSLPCTVDDERACKYCSQQRNCALLHRSVDTQRESPVYHVTSKLQQLFKDSIEHLNDDDFAYFQRWMTCTFLETLESVEKDHLQYLWLKSPLERQSNGTCITGLNLAGKSKPGNNENSFLQIFKISSHDDIAKRKFSKGDLVTISGDEPSFINITSGFVTECTDHFISVESERNFSNYSSEMMYSIDQHQYATQGSFNAWHRNMSVLMNNTPASNNLRRSIIAHNTPEFGSRLSDVIPRENKDTIANMLRGLNRTQRQAIKRVLLAKDYTLVVGMPGSGKTTTIVAMVRILNLCGFRVLLTSYTHSAVDNLLLKLVKYKVNFLRLGNKSQIHTSIHPYSEEEVTRNVSTTEDLKQIYQQANVVGCTCHSVTKHVLFNMSGRTQLFDCCIIDEASQIAQPVCLGPLLHANRFVLVGDHRQLPPLIRSKKARTMDADESLFWRLSRHKDALVELTLQYRMNKSIMDLSNFVTYEGRLECATDVVKNSVLTLQRFDQVKEELEADMTYLSSIAESLDPEQPVVFLDTSNIEAFESKFEGGVCNQSEAELIANVVKFLIKCNIDPNHIGVITPFRKQISVIENAVKEIVQDNAKLLEVNTVDKYQGRDKKVILMSFVRSRQDSLADEKGELLSDWRRLNVALTRAKQKLVMIGNKDSLMEYSTCKKLFEGIQNKDLGKLIQLN